MLSAMRHLSVSFLIHHHIFVVERAQALGADGSIDIDNEAISLTKADDHKRLTSGDIATGVSYYKTSICIAPEVHSYSTHVIFDPHCTAEGQIPGGR